MTPSPSDTAHWSGIYHSFVSAMDKYIAVLVVTCFIVSYHIHIVSFFSPTHSIPINIIPQHTYIPAGRQTDKTGLSHPLILLFIHSFLLQELFFIFIFILLRSPPACSPVQVKRKSKVIVSSPSLYIHIKGPWHVISSREAPNKRLTKNRKKKR